MSFIKHSIIVFLLLNVVRESVCAVAIDHSVASVAEEQPDLGQSDIDLPTLLAHAPKDADGNINMGKENLIAGKTNTVLGHANSVTGTDNDVMGNHNTISAFPPRTSNDNKDSEKVAPLSRHKRNTDTGVGNTITGVNNHVTGSYNVVIGNGNSVSGSNNRITGNNNNVSRSGITFTGDNTNF